jgi:IMP dehydrogenase
MVVKQEPNSLDCEFYLQAENFFSANKGCALTYDDLTLATLYSEVLPRDTQLETSL